MHEFEYLSVFLSLIFGISVTHILAGAIRSIYSREIDATRLVLTGFMFLVLILNWWTGFRWKDHEDWSSDIYLIIVFWATIHYVASITLYPPQVSGTRQALQYRNTWFFGAFTVLCLGDILQTAAMGNLFIPKAYLPFVLHFVVLCLAGIYLNKQKVYLFLAWYFLIIMTLWYLVVRRFLV